MSVKSRSERGKEQLVVPTSSYLTISKYVDLDEERLLSEVKSVERGNGLVTLRFEDAFVEMKSISRGTIVGEVYFYRVTSPLSKFVTLRFRYESHEGYGYVSNMKMLWYSPRGDGYEVEKEEVLDEDCVIRPHRKPDVRAKSRVTYADLEALVKRIANLYQRIVEQP